MLTKFQKNKLQEMINVLLPDYKYVRITSRGTIILKKSFWSLERTKHHFYEFCMTILAPLVSTYKYKTPDVSIAMYLGAYQIVQKKMTEQVVDLLFSEFSKWKSPYEAVSIEEQIKRLTVDDKKIVFIPYSEHNDGESDMRTRVLFRTIQTIILVLLFFGTAVAL